MAYDITRLKRARKTRLLIKRLEVPRLSVFRSNKHIYAQLIMPDGSVMVSASSVESAFQDSSSDAKLRTDNKAAATRVGSMIGDRILEKGLKKIAFDKSGYRYHGVLAALAQAARECGVEF